MLSWLHVTLAPRQRERESYLRWVGDKLQRSRDRGNCWVPQEPFLFELYQDSVTLVGVSAAVKCKMRGGQVTTWGQNSVRGDHLQQALLAKNGLRGPFLEGVFICVTDTPRTHLYCLRQLIGVKWSEGFWVNNVVATRQTDRQTDSVMYMSSDLHYCTVQTVHVDVYNE